MITGHRVRRHQCRMQGWWLGWVDEGAGGGGGRKTTGTADGRVNSAAALLHPEGERRRCRNGSRKGKGLLKILVVGSVLRRTVGQGRLKRGTMAMDGHGRCLRCCGWVRLRVPGTAEIIRGSIKWRAHAAVGRTRL